MRISLNSAHAAYSQHPDADSLGSLLSASTSYVSAVCKRSGHPDADDLTQEIVIKVWLALSTYRGQSSFRTWVHKIARRHLIDTARRSADPWIIPEDLDALHPPEPDSHLGFDAESLPLKEPERKLVSALLTHGSFRAVAHELGRTARSVKSACATIKRQLKQQHARRG